MPELMTPGTYTLIIPAYNEEGPLAKVLNQLKGLPGCQEIIVVDDGSTDKTAEVASRHKVRVISHPYNKGYGAAIKTGIKAAHSEHVICFDADGQHTVEDLLKIAQFAAQYDMVAGRRDRQASLPIEKRMGGQAHQDWNRVLGKRLLIWVSAILTKRKISDLNSGLRSFKTEVIKKYLHLMPDGFSFSTTSTIAMFRMGYTVHFVPVSSRPRDGRKSSVKFFKDGFKTLMLIINLTVLFNPMRIFIPLSALFIGSSMIYFLLFSILVRVHLTPSMVLLFITGVLIFFMGIVCEQVSAIRRELYH